MVGRGVPSIVGVLIGTMIGPSCEPAGDAAAPVPIRAPGPAQSEVPGPAANPAPISATAGKGTILGNVMRGAGRDPRSGSGSGATSSAPVGGDPVQARTEGGEAVARAVSSSDGTFELTLPPGNYVVSEDIAGVSQRIQVPAGVITTLTLLVPGA